MYSFLMEEKIKLYFCTEQRTERKNNNKNSNSLVVGALEGGKNRTYIRMAVEDQRRTTQKIY